MRVVRDYHAMLQCCSAVYSSVILALHCITHSQKTKQFFTVKHTKTKNALILMKIPKTYI